MLRNSEAPHDHRVGSTVARAPQSRLANSSNCLRRQLNSGMDYIARVRIDAIDKVRDLMIHVPPAARASTSVCVRNETSEHVAKRRSHAHSSVNHKNPFHVGHDGTSFLF